MYMVKPLFVSLVGMETAVILGWQGTLLDFIRVLSYRFLIAFWMRRVRHLALYLYFMEGLSTKPHLRTYVYLRSTEVFYICIVGALVHFNYAAYYGLVIYKRVYVLSFLGSLLIKKYLLY